MSEKAESCLVEEWWDGYRGRLGRWWENTGIDRPTAGCWCRKKQDVRIVYPPCCMIP